MTAPSPPLISRYHVDILSLQPRDKATMLGVSTIELFSRIIYLSNRKRFPCLHSLIWTQEGLGEFETVIHSRDEVEGLRILPTPRVVISGYGNTGKKVFYCFYKITFSRKNAKLFVWHWLKEKFLPVAKSCPRSLTRVISSRFAKRCFPKYGLFSLKMSAQAKKIDTPSL